MMHDLDLHAPSLTDTDRPRCGTVPAPVLAFLCDDPEGVTCPRCTALLDSDDQ